MGALVGLEVALFPSCPDDFDEIESVTGKTMTESTNPTTQPPHDEVYAPNLPPGDHPLEVAARRGFGPLSLRATEVWHGGARPCVTCGQLVLRDGAECEYCGQDLSPEMLERMRAHAGPWYVLEHVRPFPGISLDRVIRQIYRGLITATSIVRGPATDYQWRFAVETPGLCRYFRRCWSCQVEVSLTDARCRSCSAWLMFDPPPSSHAAGEGAAVLTGQPAHAGAQPSASAAHQEGKAVAVGRATSMPIAPSNGGWGTSRQMEMLRAAARQAGAVHRDLSTDDTLRIGGVRVAWIAVVIVATIFLGLIWITQVRSSYVSPAPKEQVPSVVLPSRAAPELDLTNGE
jgi:hypothetical protein